MRDLTPDEKRANFFREMDAAELAEYVETGLDYLSELEERAHLEIEAFGSEDDLTSNEFHLTFEALDAAEAEIKARGLR